MRTTAPLRRISGAGSFTVVSLRRHRRLEPRHYRFRGELDTLGPYTGRLLLWTNPCVCQHGFRCRGAAPRVARAAADWRPVAQKPGASSPTSATIAVSVPAPSEAERVVSGFRTCVPGDVSLMSRDMGHTQSRLSSRRRSPEGDDAATTGGGPVRGWANSRAHVSCSCRCSPDRVQAADGDRGCRRVPDLPPAPASLARPLPRGWPGRAGAALASSEDHADRNPGGGAWARGRAASAAHCGWARCRP